MANVKEVEEPKKPVPVFSMIRGMGMLGKNLLRKPVTIQYPEQMPYIPERFRFRIFLTLDSCVGCTLCEQVCPNGSIKMEHLDRENPHNKRKIYPGVNFGTCTVCRNCEEICPTHAIYLSHEFQTSRTKNSFYYSPEELSKPEHEVLK